MNDVSNADYQVIMLNGKHSMICCSQIKIDPVGPPHLTKSEEQEIIKHQAQLTV